MQVVGLTIALVPCNYQLGQILIITYYISVFKYPKCYQPYSIVYRFHHVVIIKSPPQKYQPQFTTLPRCLIYFCFGNHLFITKKKKTLRFGIILKNGVIVLIVSFIFSARKQVFFKRISNSKYNEFVFNHLGTMLLELLPWHPIDSPPCYPITCDHVNLLDKR